jgi:hypothetical protein
VCVQGQHPVTHTQTVLPSSPSLRPSPALVLKGMGGTAGPPQAPRAQRHQRAPAVLDRPITTPAYLGAMSMWFTLKPPRENPSAASVSVVSATPEGTPVADGMTASAAADATMPAGGRGGGFGGVGREGR